jgi:hypothetical protein
MLALTLSLVSSVFLNGVNIDGLRSQSFERCKTVRIDERGDVHLDCPAYSVEQAPTAQPPANSPAAATPAVATGSGATPAAVTASATPGALSKHYWLVTEQTEGGAAQYDMDIWINSKWLGRKIKSGEGQIVLDITRFLVPGPNKIIFAPQKRIEGARKSASTTAYLRIVIGEGEAGQNNVMIDNPLLEVKRTAADMENRNEEHTVTAR